MVAPKPTSAGRCGPKVQLTRQRVDARPASCLDLEFVCGGTRSSGFLAHKLPVSTLSYLMLAPWVIHQSFKSLFTGSSHIKFGRPLPLFSLPVRLITPLRTGASADLCWICPNHLKRCCINFSSTSATPSLSRMSSFRTRSLQTISTVLI
jgi:hypothetical protein